MTRHDHIAHYTNALATGDLELLKESMAESFEYKSPYSGSVDKPAFLDYLSGVSMRVAAVQGAEPTRIIFQISNLITHDQNGELTAWWWWSVPGTTIEGATIAKATDAGVTSQHIAYYNHPSLVAKVIPSGIPL